MIIDINLTFFYALFGICIAFLLTYWHALPSEAMNSHLGASLGYVWHSYSHAIMSSRNMWMPLLDFPLCYQQKGVEPSNLFCSSADFGFYSKKSQDYQLFTIWRWWKEQMGWRASCQHQNSRAKRLRVLRVLWGTLGNGPNTGGTIQSMISQNCFWMLVYSKPYSFSVL